MNGHDFRQTRGAAVQTLARTALGFFRAWLLTLFVARAADTRNDDGGPQPAV